MVQSTDFNAIRISLASPDQVKQWSYGEVTKPETINYRTLRPEKDGLFCERIFGPTKDWECHCGKYKKIRYKGVICDRCGVEVARAKVRRERMGHISLSAPVAHIWFAKGIPSRLGLLLDLSPRNLERVLYFAQYIITSIDPLVRAQLIESLESANLQQIEALHEEIELEVSRLQESTDDGTQANSEDGVSVPVDEAITQLRASAEQRQLELEGELKTNIDDLESLRRLQLLTETRCRDLRDRFGGAFKASMGAEAILDILKEVNLELLSNDLQNEVQTTSGQRRKKAVKRLRIVEAFRKGNNQPEWMVLTTLPVLPPDLRPMVQLDGGRFATSDLNDLYRRVINRNSRLRRLLELGAPEIIVRNEKRMLQEAVDDLIDNGRRGRPIVGSHNHKLKSLSDLLRGKQGRFRQNLLGKRVDYGGRSVIVVGPSLQLHQCGLPKRMALELFKPFVMNKMVAQGVAHNIKSAKRLVERMRPEVWDILEEVIKGRPVLLNRAPTLHRLGIQAFMPVLVEGSAIQIHPLVCTAFNADFDGDQMAVHVPLSREAVLEARNTMLSVYNMLSPSSGEPIVAPTLDMVLGCYYLTMEKELGKGAGRKYSDFDDALLAYESGVTELQASIEVRDVVNIGQWITTTPGRIIFNEMLPQEVRRYGELIDKKAIKEIVTECYQLLGNEETAALLDRVKEIGFYYATRSGITIGITDIAVPPEKTELVANAYQDVEALEAQFEQGLITEKERYTRTVGVWQGVSNEMDKVIAKHLPEYGGIYIMAHSGAKGNEAQIKQMAGMRGLMSNPKGEIIDLPITSSFREGLSVLEYFISTHGARKGLADTALRTADSGYLTRRLIDVAQEVIVLEEDCGTDRGVWIRGENSEEDVMMASLLERVLGRITASPIAHPETGEILLEANQVIGENIIPSIESAEIQDVHVRSPLNCVAKRGLCRQCYGRSSATGRMVLLAEAIGIIAAQSIGEPGTQLTMRTFHTGGVAGKDITSGLPRVEELFEARSPKGKSKLSEIDGDVLVFRNGQLQGEVSDEVGGSTRILTPPIAQGIVIRVASRIHFTDQYELPAKVKPIVSEGDWVTPRTVIASRSSTTKGAGKQAVQPDIVARTAGQVHLGKNNIEIVAEDVDIRDHAIDATDTRMCRTGDKVIAGQKITMGVKDPHDILRIEGAEATERYLLEQVQTVYRNQGVTINDKHIEVIVRQMLRWLRVESPGDTDLLPNQLIDKLQFQAINSKVIDEGGAPATSKPEILGVTRASLNTDSFLAKASFQETTRVLTESALMSEVDHLRGLKENVIIGRLIPARLDVSEEGRLLLGVPISTPTSITSHADIDGDEVRDSMPGNTADAPIYVNGGKQDPISNTDVPGDDLNLNTIEDHSQASIPETEAEELVEGLAGSVVEGED